MRVLALNAGSSSLKAVLRSGGAAPTLSLIAERIGLEGSVLRAGDEQTSLPLGAEMSDAVKAVGRLLAERRLKPDAVAHRIVHGGSDHYLPSVIDDALLADLRQVAELAPLHMPPALDSVEVARGIWSTATHVACFDTAFHHDLPESSIRLPLPAELTKLGVRRYGFHGLSVQSVLLSRPELRDVVVAHLGSGCSATAVGPDRRPRHTTMSMTPTSGMMSSTRPGDLDPEILLYLIERHGYSTQQLREVLDRQSGLSGVSGGRRDMRDLLDAQDHDAELALAMFVSSAAMAIAACATTLDDWRWLVFTGGIGEHAGAVRARICDRLRLSGTAVLTVPADEERVMDEMTRDLLGSRRRSVEEERA